MSIIRKVRAVERLFGRLDAEISNFQSCTGLHCISGCGKCCSKPDIEATPLEFLPLAYHWFINRQATAMLEQLENNTFPFCMLYAPLSSSLSDKGSCSSYPHRGLICRLFGYGASRDKIGALKLVTCRQIKEQQADNYEKAISLISQGEYIPIFSDYYKKLMQIDFKLANQFMTVNEAIRVALETVLSYYAYRSFPRQKKAA